MPFSPQTTVLAGNRAFYDAFARHEAASVTEANVFALERSEWQLVHHRTDAMASGSESRRSPVTRPN